MKSKGIKIPDDAMLIRGLGHSNIIEQDVPIEEQNPDCLILGVMDQEQNLLKRLVEGNTTHTCKSLNQSYGGPKTLVKYNSIVLHLPYQVSTMKMWENAKEGIITAIPTPRFFTEICTENDCKQSKHVFAPKEITDEENWWKYVEFYLREFATCFIQYDSWDQLDKLLTEKTYLDKVDKCKAKIKDMESINLKLWEDFFHSL